VLAWISLSDFYRFPFISSFDSFQDLPDVVADLDLSSVRQRMEEYNEKEGKRVEGEWKKIFNTIKERKKKHTNNPTTNSKDLNSNLQLFYNYSLNLMSCVGEKKENLTWHTN